MILARVDLPEPFWPTTPWISPGRIVRVTPRSTDRDPNVLEASRISSRSRSVAVVDVIVAIRCGAAGWLAQAPELLELLLVGERAEPLARRRRRLGERHAVDVGLVEEPHRDGVRRHRHALDHAGHG